MIQLLEKHAIEEIFLATTYLYEVAETGDCLLGHRMTNLCRLADVVDNQTLGLEQLLAYTQGP